MPDPRSVQQTTELGLDIADTALLSAIEKSLSPLLEKTPEGTHVNATLVLAESGSAAASPVDPPRKPVLEMHIDATVGDQHAVVPVEVTREVVSTLHARELLLEKAAGLHGLSTDELLDTLLEASVAASSPDSDLPAAEAKALRAAGISLAGPASDATGLVPVMKGLARVTAFRNSALGVAAAAAALGVTASRVRQRIKDREILSLPTGDGSHLLPAWQFVDGSVVPGLATIAVAAEGLHPLTLAGFMQRADPDLVVGDEWVSPIAWLISGGAPSRVVALVTGLRGAA